MPGRSSFAAKIDAPANTALPETVTESEFEILKHTVNCWDAKRIPSAPALSVLTVRKHIANIYQKLHINSKAQIINLAHKNKWV